MGKNGEEDKKFKLELNGFELAQFTIGYFGNGHD